MKLEFNDEKQKARYVCEVFGMQEAVFDMVCKAMYDHFQKVGGGDNNPSDSKTEALEDFMGSQAFTDLGLPFKTANDFFMFGYIFAAVVSKQRSDDMPAFLRALMEHRGHDHSGDEGGEERN